jgi:hypothetical protein
MGLALQTRFRRTLGGDPFRCYFNAPAPPDPTATSNAQAQYNQQAAQSQAEINDVNQTTPYGSLSYQQTGTAADGTPMYTATTSYTPAMQQLFNTAVTNQNTIGSDATALANSLGSSLTNAPNLNPSAITNEAMKQELQYMSPFFTQQGSNLNSQLQNQGIEPGSQAYQNAQQQLQENQGNVIAGTYLQAEPLAYNQQLETYEAPIQTLGTLMVPAKVRSGSAIGGQPA